MSFTPLGAISVCEVFGLLAAKPTAVELGNQRFRANNEILAKIASRCEATGNTGGASLLREIMKLSSRDRIGRVSSFYASLGYEDYVAIDVNEEFGSIVMDLNKSVVRDYGFDRQFDLVVNNGTAEHIFDQRAVFENAHDLCKSGGIMLHVMPFHGYLNHGFYNFHPNLYLDLAAANGYQVAGIGAGNRWGFIGHMTGDLSRGLLAAEQFPLELVGMSLTGKDMPGAPPMRWLRRMRRRMDGYKTPHIRIERALERIMEDEQRRGKRFFPHVFVIAALRKTTDAAFNVPFQGRYLTAIGDDAVSGSYADQASI